MSDRPRVVLAIHDGVHMCDWVPAADYDALAEAAKRVCEWGDNANDQWNAIGMLLHLLQDQGVLPKPQPPDAAAPG